MRRWLRWLCLSLCCACVWALSACAGGGLGNDRPPADITILGTITGQGSQEIEAILAPFTEATGFTVDYQGTDAFTTILPLDLAAGHSPDLALFPQPGLMADLAQEGHLIPLNQVVDSNDLEAALGENWLALGKLQGEAYGLPLRVYLKGLVWYRPDQFATQGYTVPTTWDELQALTNHMIADGQTPWCLGLESGEATGWVATDWIEDIVLRQSGPEIYDRWVHHDLPFTDPAIKQAFETFGTIALNPQAVRGGRVGVLGTPFGDSPLPLFRDPPGCYLHDQSNFITAFFPPKVNLDEDVAFFPLPPMDPQAPPTILVGAVQLGVLRDSPAVRALVNYLLTPEPHQLWASFGGHLSPFAAVDGDAYGDAPARAEVALLKQAQVIRFDASDAMPAAVGTGSFWEGAVDYLSGVDLDTVLREIDRAWPDDRA